MSLIRYFDLIDMVDDSEQKEYSNELKMKVEDSFIWDKHTYTGSIAALLTNNLRRAMVPIYGDKCLEEITFRYNFFRGGTSIILELNEVEKYRLPVLVERSYILH